jgi:nucleotide-binding universal stress UspA family protein
MIKKILVPLDGSDLSLSVLPTIEEIAQKLGSSVVLFHAINPMVGTFPGAEMWAADARLVEEQKAAALKFLDECAEGLTAKGLEVSTLVLVGPAADETVVAAQQNGADMIAMSTHGHSGVGRWIMGSVADAVLRRTHLPCLLLRPGEAAGADPSKA